MNNQLKNINRILLDNGIGAELLHGRFGIEKENVRVLQNGELSISPHPESLGDKNIHPYITTDFSESQVEMITPPLNSIRETYGFMETLQDIVSENIGDELLWPQSLPPLIPENTDIPIARYGKDGRDKETYRELLARIYGKERQLISGIHYNFSFTDELLEKLKSVLQYDGDDESFKEHIYFKLSRNILRYRWLLIWLFGASPQTEETYKVKSLTTGTYESIHCKNGISLRNCKSGYRNKEDFFINLTNTAAYHKSINALLTQGKLQFMKELYAPVRIKFDPEYQRISHIELRFIDLNPLEKAGISLHQMHFIHLFILYCLIKEETQSFDRKEQDIANANHDRISCCGRDEDLLLERFDGSKIRPMIWAQEMINDISFMSMNYNLLDNTDYKMALDAVFTIINHPEKRIVFEIIQGNENPGFINSNLELAKKFKADSLNKTYRFHGFEDMELSTQLLLKESVRRGLQFEILDRDKNFISLSNGEKTEYIMQATKTSIDNYSSILLMEDKQITKKILAKNLLNVPSGKQYFDLNKAIKDFSYFKGRPIVIKPNSTNFGIGITILKENNNEEVYKRALEIAFREEANVLIEDFFAGEEYRFFIIGDRVEGILKRVPANVKCDGKSSIRELVTLKNQNPIRGKGYRTPLEKIKMDEAEEMFLKTQALNFESIPQKDQIIYLRENSNISTGGDSIDFTDEMHQSYKDVAVAAAKALKVKITGLDMIVRNISEVATKSNYTIIELNFNPAIHIHCYPFIGKNRRLDEKILDALELF